MISITCTQCRTVLTIDEAFAGGVCRCQHCGTIQTVPSQLKPSATPAPFVGPAASKSLYQNKASARTTGANIATTGATSPSGLDDLAQAVVSSGLSGSGLRNARQENFGAAQYPATPQAGMAPSPDREARGRLQKKSSILPLALGGGAVLLLIIGAVVYFMFFRGKSDDSAGGGPATAAFCNTPITGASVIYVLDRANSLHNDFDELKAATYQSIRSLGPDRKFAVIMWNNGAADVAFPNEGLRNATSDQIEMLQKQLDGVQAIGASVLRGALERAVARNPASIVIVTAKIKLEDDDQAAVADLKTSAKIYTFVVGSGLDNNVLKMTSKTTGGQYRQVTPTELRDASK